MQHRMHSIITASHHKNNKNEINWHLFICVLQYISLILCCTSTRMSKHWTLHITRCTQKPYNQTDCYNQNKWMIIIYRLENFFCPSTGIAFTWSLLVASLLQIIISMNMQKANKRCFTFSQMHSVHFHEFEIHFLWNFNKSTPTSPSTFEFSIGTIIHTYIINVPNAICSMLILISEFKMRYSNFNLKRLSLY